MGNCLIANSFMNLAGGAFPALVNLLTIPFIVSRLGSDNYGLLALVTSIIGYFAFLDMNVTAGSVKYIAEYNARGERQAMCEVIWVGGIAYVVIGLVGATVICIFSEPLGRSVFAIPEDIVSSAVTAIRIAAVGFLFGQLQVFLNSIPQSLSRFDISAALEVLFGTLVPAGTVGLLWMGYGLVEVVLLRVGVSVLNVGVLVSLIIRLIPDLRWVAPTRFMISKVCMFSGYAYMSRLAAVTYSHADKLIISAMGSMASLTYYIVPTTLVNRLLGLTFRLGSVLYPLASELSAKSDQEALRKVYLKGIRYITYINSFFVLMIAVFAYQILYWWMGEDFAAKGAMVMVIMALALLLDSLTNLPSMFNDGIGHPQKTGIFALVRAAIGIVLIMFFTSQFGIVGAAVGNLVASAVMTSAFLWYIHNTTIPVSLLEVMKEGYLPSFVVMIGVGALVQCLWPRPEVSWFQVAMQSGIIVSIYVAVGFGFILPPMERSSFARNCRKVLSQTG